MDLSNLNAVLRVNGLTAQSAPSNITDVLLRSGYDAAEIPAALAIINGTPVPASAIATNPGSYMAPILEHTQSVRRGDVLVSTFKGRLGIFQFWAGFLLSALLYGLLFILVEISAVPAFTLLSGISVFAPPDLTTASVPVLLLFGTGIAMIILPALFFLFVFSSLQVRRFHDLGLSGLAWLMVLLALIVGAYLLYRLTPLALLSGIAALTLWVLLVSLPGSKQANAHGNRLSYPSIWGVMRGSMDESGTFFAFMKQLLLPLVYLEISGLLLGIFVHTILPRVYTPDAAAPTAQRAEDTTTKRI